MKKLLYAAFLLSVQLFAQIGPQRPIDATITDLSQRPQEFDGRLVRIHAALVFGWEGDNFLIDASKPRPLSMPSRDPDVILPGTDHGSATSCDVCTNRTSGATGSAPISSAY